MGEPASRVVGVVETSGPVQPAELTAHLGVWRGLRFYRLEGGLALLPIVPPAEPQEADENAPPPTFDEDEAAEPPSYLRPRAFRDAGAFYAARAGAAITSGDWVVLHGVNVSDWLPLWPGLIHHPGNDAAYTFDAALPDFSGSPTPVATGDVRMVMSGVGSVRLLPTPTERPRFAWYGATFDGAAHSGVPLRVDTWRHGDLFRALRQQAAPEPYWDVIGKLYVEPAKRPGIVPRLYIDVLQLVERDDKPASEGVRATLAIIAAAEASVEPSTWLFGYVSFYPHATDPHTAAQWLAGQYKLTERMLLYDCDEHGQHFPYCLNPVRDLVHPPLVKLKPVSGNRKALAELTLLLRSQLSPHDIADAMRDLGGHSALGEPEALALVTGRPMIGQIETLIEAAARADRLANVCQLVMLRRPDLAEHLLAWRFRNRRHKTPVDASAIPPGWQQLRLDMPARVRKAG